MIHFRNKQTVRLSPKLARMTGRAPLWDNTYTLKLMAVAALSVLFFWIFSDTKSDSKTSVSEASEVLGAKTSNVANYIVKNGDTIMSISEDFGVYWMTIAEENELQSPYPLRAGQTLRIPLPRN